MIAHFHIRLQLPDTDPAVIRDVILPDSVILEDINQVISVCFGWPLTDKYEFVPQQTSTTYLGETDSFVGAKQSLPGENVPVSFVFQKNRELIYYCGTESSDRVSVTLLPTKSLLPEPVFQLNYSLGDNQPCSRGGFAFLKSKVADDLLALREEIYLLSNEFDYENAIPMDLPESFNLLDELKNAGTIDEMAGLLEGIPEEEAIALISQMMEQISEKVELTYTLDQCLDDLDYDFLQDILQNTLPEHANADREEAELLLFQQLTSREYLTTRFKKLTIPEVELLKFMCKSNMPFDTPDAALHSSYLLQCGLCFVDETGLYLTVPEDLRDLYQELLNDEALLMETQFYDMLHTFCYTAVYFYGAYPIRHLLRKINETVQMVIPVSELEEIIGPTQHIRQDYIMRDGWIIAPELAQDGPEYQNALTHLKAMHNKRTDFFWPDLDQLETLIFMRRLSNEKLYENLYKFRFYLREGLHFSMAIANLEYWIRSTVPFDIIMRELTEAMFDLPDEDAVTTIAGYLEEIRNQTPTWSLGGYTPEQMQKKEQQKEQKKTTGNGAKIISFQELRDRKNK